MKYILIYGDFKQQLIIIEKKSSQTENLEYDTDCKRLDFYGVQYFNIGNINSTCLNCNCVSCHNDK